MFPRLLASTLVAAFLSAGAGVASAQQPAANCATCTTGTLTMSSFGSGGLFGGHSLSNCNSCGLLQSFCCPFYTYKAEGAPIIHVGHACPKPVCVPCNAPNWGYYQTCWTPWPWPQDYGHCPVMPPAAVVVPSMVPNQMQTPMQPTMEYMPMPQRAGGL